MTATIDFDLSEPVGRWDDYAQAVDDGDVPITVADPPALAVKNALRQALRQGRTSIIVPQAWEHHLNSTLSAALEAMGLLGAIGPCCLGQHSELGSAHVWEVCLLPASHDGRCGPDDEWEPHALASEGGESFGWVKPFPRSPIEALL